MSFEQFNKPEAKPEGENKKRLPPLEASLEQTRLTANSLLEEIESIPSSEEFTDITKMYHALPSQELVVRRENPELLMRALTENEPVEIRFVGDTPYANSVVWNPKIDGSRGLTNAILEGYGHLNNVVMLYGFEKPEGMYLEQHPESSQVFAGIDRTRVRTASGYVPMESIRFVTMRVPINGFPESRMTEEEKDALWEYGESESKNRVPVFVYRGFLFPKEKAAHLKMAA